MLKSLARAIENNWYRPSPGMNLLLLPLWLISAPFIYWKWRNALNNPAELQTTPVVVVGNITVGGTGKTPLIVYLIERVRALGFEAGVISRGYGAIAVNYPLMVSAQLSAAECGDEPKLLQQRLNCTVVVDPVRKRAAQVLNNKVDIIFSDDGLQHYELGRDAELLVIDGERRFGNGWLLPVGPLREPVERSNQVDICLMNGADFQVNAGRLVNAKTQQQQPLTWLNNRRLHAVAGIGNPQRFFNTLKQQGAELSQHQFSDHYQFAESDFDFDEDLPVVMTEKDWVKCSDFADETMWYLTVDAELSEAKKTEVDQLLLKLLQRQVLR